MPTLLSKQGLIANFLIFKTHPALSFDFAKLFFIDPIELSLILLLTPPESRHYPLQLITIFFLKFETTHEIGRDGYCHCLDQNFTPPCDSRLSFHP